MFATPIDSRLAAAPASAFEPDLEAEFQAWLAEDYTPIAGGWHY